MQPFAIILVCILSAIAYGILHDQITARICVEYFTIGHPPVFRTESPTLLAFGWGVIATWWVGGILGAFIAIAARAGSRPKFSVRDLIRPLFLLLFISGMLALVAGVVGFYAGNSGWMHLLPPMAQRVPQESHVRFIAVLWAHTASYLASFLGGLILIAHVWRSRGRRRNARQTGIPNQSS